MNLVAGQRLGPYEIFSALGAGGMGEEFARDIPVDASVDGLVPCRVVLVIRQKAPTRRVADWGFVTGS